MIAFATLFLGLVLGPRTVEVVVGEGVGEGVAASVAAIELRLDGETLKTLTDPPFTAEIDFGLDLVPRRLEAIARDAAGEELDRAVQWLNLPQDPARGQVVLEGGPRDRVAVLRWESTAGSAPRQVRASFDGRPLAVEDAKRIPLPPHDPSQLHFLRVELDFSDNVTSVIEMSFGGTYADEISTEITALPLVFEKGRRPPPLDELSGWLVKDGEPLTITALEKGPAEVVMVVTSTFGEALHTMRNRLPRAFRNPSALMPRAMSLRHTAALRADQRVRFLYPFSESRSGVGVEYSLFPTSPEYTAADGGVYYLLAHQLFKTRQERIADAVAVAGLSSAGHRRRRAVVLVLGRNPRDESQFTPAMSRRYLVALRVPFEVWYPGREPDPAAAAWGEVVDVSTLSKLDGAVNRLGRALERQWIVWIDGTHLPQEIELGAAARGVRLVP